MSKNIYVLDSSVLLSVGAQVFKRFKGTVLVIPTTVLQIVDDHRDDKNVGYLAREVLRELGNIRTQGNIWDGVDLENGPRVIVVEYEWDVSNPQTIRDSLSTIKADWVDEGSVTLLSNNVVLSVEAENDYFPVETVATDKSNRKFLDNIQTFSISSENFTDLMDEGTIKLDLDVPVNTGVILRSGQRSALAISKPGYLFTNIPEMTLSGFKAANKEQNIAMKQLKDDSIKAVSLGGIAGGGKTAMALAAGVDAVKNHGYKKLVVFRSMHAVGGEDLGFLPGTENEKLDPWTAAVYDAMSFMTKDQIQQFKSKGMLEVLPITHVRGRTLSGAYVIVDEAQNLSLDVLRTLLTRMSHSSKIVLTHDVSQRDNWRVGRHDGIDEVVSRMHGDKLFAHTSMVKSERSELAQTATRLLDF